MKRQKVLMAVMAIAFVLGNVTLASAQAVELFVVNGTGAGITEFIISPSSEFYPKNSSCYAVDGFEEKDGGTFLVTLPGDMKEINVFDIEVLSGGKRYETQKGVIINFQNGKKAILQLHTTEKSLAEGLVNTATGATMAGLTVATTKSILPKKAAVLIAGKLAPKAGAMAAVKIGLSKIPYIGPIVIVGGLLTGGIISTVKYINKPDVLQTQVYYQ